MVGVSKEKAVQCDLAGPGSLSAPAPTRRLWPEPEVAGSTADRPAGDTARTPHTGSEVGGGSSRSQHSILTFQGVKKQQSFESYLDTDGNKKQEHEISNSYQGRNKKCN